MGGDHHHHHHSFPKIPDWRSYKVEDCPELIRVQQALASQGLKDPWLRNEVWRYDPRVWGTPGERIRLFLFRGFKWGLAAAIVSVALEKALTPSHHGHGHGNEAHH